MKRIMMTELPESRNPSRYATLYDKRYEAAQNEINGVMEAIGLA